MALKYADMGNVIIFIIVTPSFSAVAQINLRYSILFSYFILNYFLCSLKSSLISVKIQSTLNMTNRDALCRHIFCTSRRFFNRTFHLGAIEQDQLILRKQYALASRFEKISTEICVLFLV